MNGGGARAKPQCGGYANHARLCVATVHGGTRLASMLLEIAGTVAAVAVGWMVLGGVRVVNQVERAIVFRFGRARKRIREPGLAIIIPFVDRMKKINIQIVT